jgi:alkanesulfonate monooxygenase SsuD/methylene tetrahydromethanopterin reductase-like flavin-dependent oxidoreductase (luciferase family)
MKIGIQLPEVEREVRWPEYLVMARAAEEVGFESVWLGDHLLYDSPERAPWEAWTLLSALAAATSTVRLGPLVACAGFHPPAVLAKMASTIDEVSGGRFVLGVGSGWNEEEFRAFGLPFDHRASRFIEGFGIIRRLLAGERVTSEGRFWRAEDAVLLPPPARATPIMLGTSGPRQLAATLPHAHSWNTWWDAYGNTAEGFVAVNAAISNAAESAGRNPAEVERSACVLVALDPAAGERPRSDDAPPLTGAPQAIARSLHDLAEAGADEAILVLDPISEASVRECGRVLTALDA